jgi:hypothetical protein
VVHLTGSAHTYLGVYMSTTADAVGGPFQRNAWLIEDPSPPLRPLPKHFYFHRSVLSLSPSPSHALIHTRTRAHYCCASLRLWLTSRSLSHFTASLVSVAPLFLCLSSLKAPAEGTQTAKREKLGEGWSPAHLVHPLHRALSVYQQQQQQQPFASSSFLSSFFF